MPENENLPQHIQDAVNRYVELYQVSKQLEERMKELRDVILPFMQEGEVGQIADEDHRGKVQLQVAERAPVTARYTTYNLDDLASHVDPLVLQKCVVSVIDKDKLVALSKLGEVGNEVLSLKATKPSYSLLVRLEK